MMTKLKESFFTLLILVCTVGYMIMASGYGPQARMMPLIVGSLSLVLSIIQLVFDFTGRDRKKAQRAKKEPERDIPDEHSILGKASNAHTVAMFVSLGVLFGLIYLVGFIIAIPIFLLGFLLIIAKKKVLRAVIFSVALSSVIYVLFVTVLQAQLYKGILFM